MFASCNDMQLIDWIRFFLTSWGIPFTVYLILQIGSIIHLKGRNRKIALIPLPIMFLVVIITIIGYQRDINLSPIYIILVSPIAALFVGTVWLSGAKKQKDE